MKEILFKGKRVDNGKWVYGFYFREAGDFIKPLPSAVSLPAVLVDPDTVCQYTGMREFINQSTDICGKLFEGDIVEVWSRRRLPTESFYTVKSTYDGECEARAVIVFKDGKWQLDYNNAYNNKIAKARGGEIYDRVVNAGPSLYNFGVACYKDGGESFMRLNPHCKWDDIKCIGNIYDNPELLEA